MISDPLLNDLWAGEKAVAFFVHSGACYWMIDHKYNFTLDAEKDYRAYLAKGHITREQYLDACIGFRGGILKLTKDNFRDYLLASSDSVASRDVLRELLQAAVHGRVADLIRAIERHFVTGEHVSGDTFRTANAVAAVLPSFYINFDRKIFMHMDFDRSHEDLAYSDWFAKPGDFSFLVPDEERYWTLHGDAWKLRFL